MRLVAAALVALALTVVPSDARKPTTHYVRDQPGGVLLEHIRVFTQWAKRGDRVVVEGDCFSACTLMLGVIPPADICAKPGGVFGFHSARDASGYSYEGTVVMWWMYGGRVREALARRGWAGPSEHPGLIFVPADELVRRCPA